MTRRVLAARITVKVTEFVVPPGVVKVMLLAPTVALEAIVKLPVIVVAVEVPSRVMPETLFQEAPVKYVPVKVTGTAAPCFPDPGLMPVSVGVATVTVKVIPPLVPPVVVTVTFLAPAVAVGAIVKVAVTVVDVDDTDAKVIPERAVIVAPLRLVPVRVTDTASPAFPDGGLTALSVGSGGITVKVKMLEVPPVVVTVRFLRLRVAVPETTRLVTITVSLYDMVLLATPTPEMLT